MIERYQTKDMQSIWCDQNKYETWLKVELAAVEVLCEEGIVPATSYNVIKNKAKFSVERTLEIEKTTNHDVIAFLTNLAENIGPDSRYIHMGMTSSDLLDTSMALQCKEAGEIILKKLKKFKTCLRAKAVEHRETFQIGRSHGVHAEPITFGLKLALWSEEIGRNIDRWQEALKTISAGKISGAVGTYQHLDPKIEKKVCEKLGLEAASVSNQVIQRDRHAYYLNMLAMIGCTIEKIAIDMGYVVSKLPKNTLELLKDGRFIYAEIDYDFCSVTLVSKIDNTNPEKINYIYSWNNKKGYLGKATYSDENIYFEQTMILANAPEELIAMQMIIYEVEVQKFYMNIKKINKIKI